MASQASSVDNDFEVIKRKLEELSNKLDKIIRIVELVGEYVEHCVPKQENVSKERKASLGS
jgi:hypothetical protein